MKNMEWKKIGVGAGVAMVGAGLTYLVELVPTLNIPDAYLPLVVALLSVAANVVRKYASA